MNLSWHNTDQFDFRRVWTTFTWVLDPCLNFVFRTFLRHQLRYWLEIRLDLIQIMSNFCRVWPTFFWVVTLGKNLVFRTVLSLYKFSFPDFSLPFFMISTWNLQFILSWHNIDQIWLLLRLTFFYMSYYPLQKFQFYLLSRYWLGISQMIFSWRNTRQFQLSSQLIFFFFSYCPL